MLEVGGGADPLVGQGEAVSGQRRTEEGEALVAGRGAGRGDDDRGPAAAEGGEVRGELGERGAAIGAYAGGVDTGHGAVQQHQRGAGGDDLAEHRRAGAGRADQQTVDPAVEQGADVVVLLCGALTGIADDQAVAEAAGLVLDGVGQLGEEGVGEVADDQAEGAGPGGAQRAGDVVGAVAQLLHGGEHPLAGLRDRAVAVEDAGDRGDGDPRPLCHIFDVRHGAVAILSVRALTVRESGCA